MTSPQCKPWAPCLPWASLVDNISPVLSQLIAGGSARPCHSTREDTGSWPLVSGHRRGHLFPLQISLGSALCNKSNPQGPFSGATPQMPGMRTLTLANISKEERLGRLGLAGRRGGRWIRRSWEAQEPGQLRAREQGFCVYLLRTPTVFLPLNLVCSKFKFPRSN